MFSRSEFEDVMYGRSSSFLLEAMLRPLSVLYGLLVHLRKLLYRTGLLRSKKAGAPVLSVGNITLGGTGKTPVVMHIAGLLRARSRHPVVISRGYGRKDESEVLVVSDGERLLAGVAQGGDEPVLIGAKTAGVPVVVGSDRYQAAALARERFSSDCIVLDDGFQHMRLQRDLDIVLVDASDPFGNGRLFPAGILREPPSSLARAHMVLITNADRVAAAELERLRQSIRVRTGARIFTSRTEPADLQHVMTSEIRPLAALRGTKVFALAGIARPASFLAMLSSLGARVSGELLFPDHHPFDHQDLARLYQRAADAKVSMVITTEKDAVRLKDLNPEAIWALRIGLHVHEKAEWEAALLESI